MICISLSLINPPEFVSISVNGNTCMFFCYLYRGKQILIIIIKSLFQEGNTISTKLISLAALKF